MSRVMYAILEWARPGLCTGFEGAVEIRRAESVRRHAEIDNSISKIDAMIKALEKSNPSAAALLEVDKAMLSQRRQEPD